MAEVHVDAGICGFNSRIRAAAENMQTVNISVETECPHLNAAKEKLASVDAYRELFRKPHETEVYRILSEHLPHVACPLYSGLLKAIEVAAGLALPKDAVIAIQR
jgi:hypothetical protein